MSHPIRVMVVDDAAVVRRLLRLALNADPALEVVATAANGQQALEKLEEVKPDVVILDVEMPVMDGLETLRRIRAKDRSLPVIMFSTLTERGARVTLEALALGASDYVTKPSNVGGFDKVQQKIREELVPKCKALCRRRARPAALSQPRTPRVSSLRLTSPVKVLAIASSTGGPNALAQVIGALPEGFPVPVLIVQHMPPIFTKLLAERLNSRSPLAIQEAHEGAVVEPGTVWVAPGDYHMVVDRQGTRTVVRLHQGPPVNFCRPAADVLFESVARLYGAGTLAVVLTGMGQDGKNGCELIKRAGGHVIAQDEATSVVWGMPGAVARAGLADRILPLEEIGPEVVRIVQSFPTLRTASIGPARNFSFRHPSRNPLTDLGR